MRTNLALDRDVRKSHVHARVNVIDHIVSIRTRDSRLARETGTRQEVGYLSEEGAFIPESITARRAARGGQDAIPTTMMHVAGKWVARRKTRARTRVRSPRLSDSSQLRFLLRNRWRCPVFCRYLPESFTRILFRHLSLSLRICRNCYLATHLRAPVSAWQRCSPEAVSKIRARKEIRSVTHSRTRLNRVRKKGEGGCDRRRAIMTRAKEEERGVRDEIVMRGRRKRNRARR